MSEQSDSPQDSEVRVTRLAAAIRRLGLVPAPDGRSLAARDDQGATRFVLDLADSHQVGLIDRSQDAGRLDEWLRAHLDRPIPVELVGQQGEQMILHRFSVKPHHLDAYRQIWVREVAVRTRHGFTTHRAFVETNAEPKLTWLYSHLDPGAGEQAVRADPETTELDRLKANHVFRNVRVRPVRVEKLTHATTASVQGRIAIMRRYSITGSWDEFLRIWRRILVVREDYGFRCLFAVADEPGDMFTWSFDFDGDFADFPAAQRPYYHDPDRVALRGVFDHMADYSINPATQLLV